MRVTLLRPLLHDDYDAAEFYKLIRVNRIGKDHHLSHLKWVDDATFESTVEFLEQMARSQTEDFRFIFVDDKIAGAITMRAVRLTSEREHMIGYWLGKEFCGKGVVTRAVAQMLRDGNYKRVIATIRVANQASRRVLNKNGFIECGRLADPEWSLFVWRK